MEKKLFSTFILLAVIFFTTQCGSVKRINTSTVRDLSGRWNDTDAHLVAEEMIQDIKLKVLTIFKNNHQCSPVLIVGEIHNQSHEHIDNETFIKDIEKELINTQSARIITHGSFRQQLRNQRQDQQHNSISNDMQKQAGLELGADYMLFGYINSMVDSTSGGKHRIIFYQVNLELVNLLTNEIIWIGDKKIKKEVKR